MSGCLRSAWAMTSVPLAESLPVTRTVHFTFFFLRISCSPRSRSSSDETPASCMVIRTWLPSGTFPATCSANDLPASYSRWLTELSRTFGVSWSSVLKATTGIPLSMVS